MLHIIFMPSNLYGAIVRMQYHIMQFGTRYLQWSMVLQDPKQHFCYRGRK